MFDPYYLALACLGLVKVWLFRQNLSSWETPILNFFLFFENTAVETSVVDLRIRTFRLHVKFKALSTTPFR